MSLHFKYHTTKNTSSSQFNEQELKDSLELFKKTISKEDIGFFRLTDHESYIQSAKELFEKFSHKKHFVQVGIGGSALGPQMLLKALGKFDKRSFTLLDNVDADYITDQLTNINLKESLFYIVSKSGGTAETLACYAILRALLKDQGVSESEYSKYFVFCTENKKSELMSHIDEHNFHFQEVPLDVGGRFSVLTPVGLFPALFFGIDIEKLYQGANEIKDNLLSSDLANNNLLQTTAHVLSLLKEEGVNQTVLMPYSSKLKDLSSWFVQLWAESLGKWSEHEQKHIGLTPIPAYGATDQHSQVQLFMEGPNDKLLFLLKVNKTKSDYKLENNIEISGTKSLGNYTLNQLMLAEFEGTLKALVENDRNVISIEIDLEHLFCFSKA